MADAIDTFPNTKNDLIISLVQKELKEKVKLLTTIDDLSAFAGKGMKSIKVPKLSSFTAVNRTFGTQGDATTLVDSVDTINLDQNLYVAWIIDSSDEMQSSINGQVEYAKRAATAQARAVDASIVSTLDSVASLNINAGVPADITRDDVLEMREHLLGNEANMDDAWLVLGVSADSAMLKIDEFTRGDAYGSSNIPSGFIGRVFGIPVLISNFVAGKQAYMYERSGLGIAFQQRPEMSDQGANEFGSKSRRFVLDQLYGIGGLQLGEQGAGAAESPLVAKLEN